MSTINKADEPSPPKWMDNEFILKILRNCETDDPIEITDLKFSRGAEKGDHFASVMLRAVVEFKTTNGSSSRSMIIKTLPEPDTFMGQLLAETQIFETEISMYSDIIPKLEAELSKHGDNTKFGPKVLYHSLTPRKTIVFEDLCTQGFDTIRDRVLNIVETKKMLLVLSKWHAASYKLASENYETVKSYDKGICNSKESEGSEHLNGGIKHLAKTFAAIEGYEIYGDKLKKIAKNLVENCGKIFNAYKNGDTQSIMVLNHGDFHMKNVMFKFSGDKLEEVSLIDFQLCAYGPAVIDVIYAIYTSMSSELRLNHREELIYYYFENFLDTLKKIQFTGVPPTLADFNMDLIRHGDFEILVMATFLPVWVNLMKPVKECDVDKVLLSPNHRATLYQHPEYLKELKEALPKLLYKGILDKD